MRSSDAADYSRERIKTHTWPTPEQTADGSWRRVWRIRFKENLVVRASMERLSTEMTRQVTDYLVASDNRLRYLKDDLVIALEFVNTQEITAALITQEGDWPDELLFAAWRLGEEIERVLGKIETIDGQPRDNLPPWNFQSARRTNETEP